MLGTKISLRAKKCGLLQARLFHRPTLACATEASCTEG